MTKTVRSIVLKTVAIGDSIDNLHLSIRNMNCLRNDSIETIEQLDAISDPALLKIPNMGLPSLKALRAEVDRYLNRDPKRLQARAPRRPGIFTSMESRRRNGRSRSHRFESPRRLAMPPRPTNARAERCSTHSSRSRILRTDQMQRCSG